LAPPPALDESPPLPFGPLSTKEVSFEPHPMVHSNALTAVKAVKAVKVRIRIGSARRKAADPAIAWDTVAAVSGLLALLTVLTTDTHAARTRVARRSSIASAAVACAAVVQASVAGSTAAVRPRVARAPVTRACVARAAAAATTGGISARADDRTRG
jgi:hypothetical protein